MKRVLGVGSPWGDDRVGWELAERVAAGCGKDVEVRVLDRPGLGLIEHLRGAESVLILDAVLAGESHPAGSVVEVELCQLAPGALRSLSSHGFGVQEAIELAAKLGPLPARLGLIGVAVTAESVPAEPEASLSENTADAMEAAFRRAEAWLEAAG